ncbi:MAG TPA: indole-3-glycerol-phosphate synthase [Candidatus Limnocylindria bacterium]|nr:indole-3-glycerol-phosphate synthase [Candidatus Limnocylindria bacterium]
MSDFLEQVVAERRADAIAARARVPETDVLARAVGNVWTRARRPHGAEAEFAAFGGAPVRLGDMFTARLQSLRRERRLAVVAEVKRVSPTLGELGTNVDPAAQARRYAQAGASAISVLTEPRHWGGSLADLAAVREAVPSVPLLCKDIVVSGYQVAEARAAGADAILLIAEALSDVELRRLIRRARELNMGALVEAHEPVAFGRAVASGALVVGANARDLRRPGDIDTSRARQLHSFVREDQIFVAESGIETVDDARLLPSRVDAVLVGTALMRAPDPAPLIRGLSAIRTGPARAATAVGERAP